MFALIHSPLVGPSTWKPVAKQLKQQGYTVVVPALLDSESDSRPIWEQHAESAAEAIGAAGASESLILVGHSGAGPLLPAVGARLNRPPSGYTFVDAGLPQDQATRLDLMRAESPEWADDFEKYLQDGGRFPTWTDAEVQHLVPDEQLRQQLLAELRHRELPFFTEPISVPGGWEVTPCGYIQFTETYAIHARRAEQSGWPLIRYEAGHFHMLVDPRAVARTLIHLAEQLIS